MAASYTWIFIAVTLLQLVSACIWRRPGPTTVCCAELGDRCFGKNIAFTLPICPEDYAHQFILFIRSNRQAGIPFSKDNIPSDFSNDRKTVFIVHGWLDSFSSMFQDMKDKLLTADDYNVIAVDWKGGAEDSSYFPAAANTQPMGALIGMMVNNLRQKSGSNPHYWCIGHSLGAHVCGYAYLTAESLLDRITGLNPSGASFFNVGLKSTAAAKVDIIHTDPFLGLRLQRGTVDFYPNGGQNQPGCPQSRSVGDDYDELSDKEKVEIMRRMYSGRSDSLCNHIRSIEYMITSIETPNCYPGDQSCTAFWDIPGSCDNITESSQYGMMGYDAPNHPYSGIFTMRLSTTAPFCTETS